MALCVSRFAPAADLGKMSPYVRNLVSGSVPSYLFKAPPSGQGGSICMFVMMDPANAYETIGRLGGRVIDRSDDIFIVVLPVSKLDELSDLPYVHRLEAGAPCRIDMDTTTLVVNARPASEGAGLPQAYTGKGVVMGIMDIGFDLTHPTFYSRDLSDYRIKAFWDFLSPDTVGSPTVVGRDFTNRDDILYQAYSTDGLDQTHGTHTLGSAAGSGYNTPYSGFATGSDICAVSNVVGDHLNLISPSDYYMFTTATDALGFKYIFDYASSVDRPCVASFSEGYYPQYSADDSLFSEYLGRLTGPGRIIVASAGNEAYMVKYLGKPADRSTAGSFLAIADVGARFMLHADGALNLHLLGYHDSVPDTFTIGFPVAVADTPVVFHHTLPGGERLDVAVESWPSSTPGVTNYRLDFTCTANFQKVCPIAAVLDGYGTMAGMRSVCWAQFANGLADSRWSDADNTHCVHAPACFDCVIAVGATVHRTGYTNYLGEYLDYSPSDGRTAVHAEYSSLGPTLDGRIKPDVVAPGSNVISSYSSYYLERHPNANDIRCDVAHFDFEGRTYAWNGNSGTSMAAPVVAGAVALWLEAKPDLTPADIKELLGRTARRPEPEMEYPNNVYGHGEIDVYRGLLDILGINGIAGVSTANPAALRSCSIAGGRLALEYANPVYGRMRISMYSVGGGKIMERSVVAAGERRVSVEAPAVGSGVYVVQSDGPDPATTGSVMIRR